MGAAGGWGGGERVKAPPYAPTRKTEEAVDRRQNKNVKAVSALATAQQLVYFANGVSTSVALLLSNNCGKRSPTF